MSGVTSTGFEALTLTEIKDGMKAAVLASYGASFDVSDESPVGILISIAAERVAECWDNDEQLYASFSRDGATGQALDLIGALTGTPREAPRSSTVTVQLEGTAASVIPAGTVFAVEDTEVQFETTEEVTLDGSGDGEVECESVLTGPLQAPAGTLTVIVTPVSGLTSVTNGLDADLGADLETDAAYRRRQELELRAAGKAAVIAIRDSLLQVEDVESATVFENTTDTTDGDGLPPHSIECLVSGGEDADIAETIFNEKAAGIATYGTETEAVTDDQGITHSIKFSRPDEIEVYVKFELVVDPDSYPADGDDQVKAAAVAFGDGTYVNGKNVVSSALAGQVVYDALYNRGIAGVLDAVVKISTSPTPTLTTTISIDLREIAVLDTSRITVTTSDGTP